MSDIDRRAYIELIKSLDSKVDELETINSKNYAVRNAVIYPILKEYGQQRLLDKINSALNEDIEDTLIRDALLSFKRMIEIEGILDLY